MLNIISSKSILKFFAFLSFFLFVLTLFPTQTLFAQPEVNPQPNPQANQQQNPSSEASTPSKNEVASFCEKVSQMYSKLKWSDCQCNSIAWSYNRVSENGFPLVYSVFEAADSNSKREPVDTTLLLGGVHGDETGGVYFLFRLAEELKNRNKIPFGHKIIIAPLINPDGFFVQKRTNANGVDLNRNLPTADWNTKAIKIWRERYKYRKSNYPGKTPASEVGTLFQMDLLQEFDPDKIVSIHSPLNFIDYDGPENVISYSDASPKTVKVKQQAISLARELGYKTFKNYPFFPGSLGNYAGNERHIPTITLELQTSKPFYAKENWTKFSKFLYKTIEYSFQKVSLASTKKDE